MENQKVTTELVVIGGSAGSLQVTLETIRTLKSDLKFPIVLVFHRKAQAASILPNLLQHFCEAEIIEIEDKAELQNGKIYIVPADYHLLFDGKTTAALDGSEKMNYSRPSIDVTFRSAAQSFGNAVVGILLSGANADGVAGLQCIKENHGRVWIQDPETAQVDYMPKQAMQNVAYDLIINPSDLATHINQL